MVSLAAQVNASWIFTLTCGVFLTFHACCTFVLIAKRVSAICPIQFLP